MVCSLSVTLLLAGSVSLLQATPLEDYFMDEPLDDTIDYDAWYKKKDDESAAPTKKPGDFMDAVFGPTFSVTPGMDGDEFVRNAVRTILQQWMASTAAVALCQCTGDTCDCCTKLPLKDRVCNKFKMMNKEKKAEVTVRDFKTGKVIAALQIDENGADKKVCLPVYKKLGIEECIYPYSYRSLSNDVVEMCVKKAFKAVRVTGKLCMRYDGVNDATITSSPSYN